MKKIIFLLALIVSFNSYSQTSGIIDGKFYTGSKSYTWWSGGKFNTLNIPKSIPLTGVDTGSVYYRMADSSIYVRTGYQWLKINSASLTSVTSYNGRTDAVIPIKADYAQWFLDTTYRRADSVFGVKDGVEYFQYALESDSAETYQWSVIDSLSVPPVSVFEGDKYLVGTAPTGVFAGHANEIATYDGSVYTFETATTGDLLYNATLAVVDKFNGSTWDRLVTPTNVNWWTRLNENNVVGQFARIGPFTYSSIQQNSTSYGFRNFWRTPNGTSGSVAIGPYSQHHNWASGYNNTSVGNRALWYGVTGHDNIAIGYWAMDVGGNSNYAIGLGTRVIGETRTFSISDSTTKMRMKLDSAAGAPYSIVGVDALGNWRRFAPISGGTSYTFSNGTKENAGDVTAGGQFEADSISYVSNSQKIFRIQSRVSPSSLFYSDFQQSRPYITSTVYGGHALTYAQNRVSSSAVEAVAYNNGAPGAYGTSSTFYSAFQAAVYNGTVGRMLQVTPTSVYFARENATFITNRFEADSSIHYVRQVYGGNYRSLYTDYTLVDKGWVDSVLSTISGSTTLNNVGTGFDLAQQGTANVKRIAAGTNVTLDSITTANTVIINASGSGGSQTFPQVLATGRTLAANDSILHAGFSLYNKGGLVKMDSFAINTPVYIPDSSWFDGTSITAGISSLTEQRYRFSTRVANWLGSTEKNSGVGASILTIGGIAAPNIAAIPTNPANYRYAFLEWGVNDMNNGVDTADFAAAYLLLIDSMIARGWPTNKIVILTTSYCDSTKIPTATMSRMLEYNICCKAVATRRNTRIVDVWLAQYNNGRELLFSDGIHPNDYSTTVSYVNPIIKYLTDSVKKEGQIITVNGLAEFQKIKLRTSDTASYLTVPLGLDSAGNMVRYNTNTLIQNTKTIGQVQGANISINGQMAVGGAGSVVALQGVEKMKVSGGVKADFIRVTGSLGAGTVGNGIELGMNGGFTAGYIGTYNRTSGLPLTTNINPFGGTVIIGTTGGTGGNYGLDVAGGTRTPVLQITGGAAPTTGSGLELNGSGGNGFIQTYNRGAGSATNLAFMPAGGYTQFGSNSPSGTNAWQFTTGAANFVNGVYFGGNAVPSAKITIAAGTATAGTAPIKFTTGTNLTTPVAGAMEYTTPKLYFTNGSAIRQEIPLIQQSTVSTQFDATSTTTLANITGLTASVAASGVYRFEATLYTSSVNTGGVKVAIGGTATATAIIYEGLTTDAGLTTQSRATALGTAVGAVTAITAGYIKITGTITVNAAGTLTVQFAQNASDATASSVLVGSVFVVTQTN